MDSKMSEYQKKLATENYDLVAYCMGKHGLSENDIEDWHGVLSISLCESAISYCPYDLVPFRDYALARMEASL